MIRVAVTKGTLRIPPTYFAVQHTERLMRDDPGRFAVRTLTMALQLDDPAIRDGGLDIVEAAALPGASFRAREVTMPLSFPALTRAIIDFEPHVIHQHFASWATPAVRASRRSGAPLLVTLHGADVFAALRPLNALPLRGRPMLAWHHASVSRALGAAHRVLPVSRFLADRAIEAGARLHSIEVHYQGIDTDYFSPGSEPAADLPEVVFVGALSRAKGVLDLLAASRAVVSRAPHRLVIIGRGPLRDALVDAVRENPHVELVGGLPRDAVRERLRRAHLLVLPTQHDNGWREAAGLVLLEAQSCGVPVVAYNSGGAPEMLDPGRTGIVVDERDIDGLGVAISDLLGLSASDRARLGADARTWVIEHRSLSASARQLAALYEEAAH